MNSTSSTLNALLIGVIVVGIMFVAREVLIPIALAGILAFMLAPAVRTLQNLRIPRALAVPIVVVAAFAVIFALGRVLAKQVRILQAICRNIRRQSARKSPVFEAGVGERPGPWNARNSSCANSTKNSKLRKRSQAKTRHRTSAAQRI
jgi:predicted PurR-regulated permease PerM